MALCKCANSIIAISGQFGGVYFTRDKSGLHVAKMPRHTKRRTAAQHVQRNAFTRARAFSKINRTVSYNIHRALMGLPMAEPPPDYQIPKL